MRQLPGLRIGRGTEYFGSWRQRRLSSKIRSLEELRQRASEDATFAGKVIYGLSAGTSASFCGGYGHFSESRLEMKPLPERGCSFATFLDASSKKKKSVVSIL